MLLDASGPDSKLKPRNGDSDLVVQGSWLDGQWRVLFKRARGIAAETADGVQPKDATRSGDLVFRKGQFIPVSFANWDGNNGEVGSKHTLTPWFWLLLPYETNYTMVYGMSLGTTLVFLLLGVLLIWYMRRNRPQVNMKED